ncbi:MAG: acetate kinase [Clostridia bacterium]|nr:acetate kinase [Clostridia bacterium]
MKVLVINAGSSSLKYQLIDMDTKELMAKGLCERIGIEGSLLKHTPAGKDAVKIEEPMPTHADAIKLVIDALVSKEHGVIADMSEIGAVGHRVVHGGEAFSSSVIITDEVKEVLKECSVLAPLHNPANLIGIEACEQAMPGVPQIGVFDTAFHQTMPPEAYTYALPYEYYEKYKVRRYGFHGTSHYYVSKRAAEMLGKPIEDLNIITCHLGNGSSLAAVKGGKCIDTSMGFTPLAGVEMGTRCGDIDPAIIPFIMEKEGITIDEMNTIMNKKSGVDGVSGISSDFRDVEAEADKGNARAKLALDIFAYTVKRYIGMYMAALGRVDAIVFTAGVGENSAEMRERIVSNLDAYGIKLDSEKNKVRGKEAIVSTDDAGVKILVVPTNEELTIAQFAKELLA